MRQIPILLSSLMFILVGSADSQTLHFVNQTTSGMETGESWTNAFASISAALTQAASGDEIWVASGTYSETIILPKGVSLYAGFSGVETLRNERDWASNPTIIDGSGSEHTVVTFYDSEEALMDGFTITGGRVIGSGGGVVFASVRSATLSNCAIVNNHVSENGGGIFY